MSGSGDSETGASVGAGAGAGTGVASALALRIPASLIGEMCEYARRAAPAECCGILFGLGAEARVCVPIANKHKNPRERYQMDERQMLKALEFAERRALTIVAFYHSHTYAAARPSAVDSARAVESGWTEPFYVIVSLADEAPDVRAFKIGPDGASVEVAILS